jgi:hypothetical protein
MRFRFHRGGLAESLATTVVVHNITELRNALNSDAGLLDKLTPMDRINFVAQPTYSKAMRDQGRWETHLVSVNGMAFGYSDGVLSFEEPQVERRATAPTNRMPAAFNPKDFQAMLVGRDSIKVSDLSHDDAMQMLCMAMTVITRLECDANISVSLIDEWHNGDVKPDPSFHDELRTMLTNVKDRIEGRGAPKGYLDRAYDKVVSAIDCLDADERQPTE